jgi:hypothetical protein
VRGSAAIVALLLSGGVAVAVPLPRPRPATVEPATPTPLPRPLPSGSFQPFSSAPQPTEAATPSPCQVALKALAVFASTPPVKGPGQCGIDDPVRLEAVILPDQAHVTINPPAMLRCDMATAISQWIRQDVAPTAAKLGAALTGIENYDSYDCRGRNRVVGAKMSEHGRGNALDIRAVKLASGTVAHLTDVHVTKAVRIDLRHSACERFTTVLGPGSDGYHESHIHVDLAVRHGGYRICQWEVRQPLDRVSPSPHIASSRAPTPLEAMTKVTAAPAAETSGSGPVPLPRPRRAAGLKAK